MQSLLGQLKGVGLASLLSIGLHGVLAVAVLYLPGDWFAAAHLDADPVLFEIIEPDTAVRLDPPEPEPFPDELPAPLPDEETLRPPPAALRDVPQPPLSPERRDPDAVPDPSVAQADTVETDIQVPDVTPDSRAPIDPRSRAAQILLAPSNVARGSYVVTGPGPSQRSGPAGLARVGPRHLTEAEAEALHTSHLRERAMSKTHTQREPFRLARRADGSYAYQGHRFTGIVRPDGSVTFQDQGNVQTDGFSTSGSWDLGDALMGAAGQDPYAAERERFMRETEELRHRLEAAHRQTEMAGGLSALRGRLRRVWATTNRSEAARRRRLFQIWDEISEDGTGERARRIVVTFIRTTIPMGSEHAYTESEIERFNSSRESEERFEPY